MAISTRTTKEGKTYTYNTEIWKSTEIYDIDDLVSDVKVSYGGGAAIDKPDYVLVEVTLIKRGRTNDQQIESCRKFIKEIDNAVFDEIEKRFKVNNVILNRDNLKRTKYLYNGAFNMLEMSFDVVDGIKRRHSGKYIPKQYRRKKKEESVS